MRKCQKIDKKQENELECFIGNKNHSSKEVKKAQVVLMLDKELTLNIIKNLTGYSRRRSFSIRKQYLEKGLQSIEDKDRKNPQRAVKQKTERRDKEYSQESFAERL